ncbi:MAG: biotin/lipoyl-binding protein [Bacteroidales bacterium]|nr:biotin/lipoyl-binding protein [Bacteroidales bacterium]
MKELKKEPVNEYKVLVIDGVEYQTLLTKKYVVRKPYARRDFGQILAFIPGTVTAVYVKEGEMVKHGQDLVELEAMKMLNQLKAPFDAKVMKVNAVAGERVVKNYILVELKALNEVV